MVCYIRWRPSLHTSDVLEVTWSALNLVASNCQIGGGSGKLLSIDVGTCGYACEAAYSIRVTGKVFGLKWGVPTSGAFHQACHM